MLLSRRQFGFAASAAALAACSRQTSAPGDQRVHVYSSRHYETDRQLYAAFTEATGIEVRVLPAPGDQLLERLRAEGDRTEADLIVTADAGNLYRLKDAQLLQAVTTSALEAAVPDKLHDPEGYWWAFAKRARIIIYRKDAVDPATLTSMDDLAQPRFRGQVCARSSSNVYNLSLLAARIERDGADAARAWARRVRENFARDPQGGDIEQIRAVAAGECQVAISNHYYMLRLMRSEDPADQAAANAVGMIFPDQQGAGTHVNISGGGVSAYAGRRDNAVRLLEYLVGEDAQRIIAPLNVEFPIRTDVPLTDQLAAIGPFKEEEVQLEALGRRQAEAAAIFEEVGWR
ncbi:MAG: extracellular solute-binding protein [Hyphomonadaceae bacterium]